MGKGQRTVSVIVEKLERRRRLIVLVCLATAAVLAINSLFGDSITFDETSKLTAGMSYLKTGDFRLGHDHPPLGKMWAACPLLLMKQRWPSAETLGWRLGSVWHVGRAWLFELNDGERLLTVARCAIVVLFLGTCLCVYAMARSLFGALAGLLALVLAVLSPTFLAHGRLVTTDMPVTFCMSATLLAFAHLMNRITWRRLLATFVAAGALSLVKFSWPLLLPALAVMTLVAVFRAAPIPRQPASLKVRGNDGRERLPLKLVPRRRRAAAVVVIWVLGAVAVWVMIWSGYGWRYSPFHTGAAESAILLPDVRSLQDLPADMDGSWQTLLHDRDGKPLKGLAVDFIRWARTVRLLPEAYLFGLAYTLKTTRARQAYLNGEFSATGWRFYFPVAFAIKTPIPTMLLLVMGLTALVVRRAPLGRDPVLMVGIATMTVVYGAFTIASNINIGHRHLLPIYPAVAVFAGVSATWISSRIGRWVVVLALGWLLVANLRIHPHYLSYFNEFVGGARNGHLYLADSNIDWGQDLKRLAEYARRRPGETIKLAYFGSGDPTKYGFDCQMLHYSAIPFGRPADLTSGTYVISVTHLLGVYWLAVRDSFWETPDAQETYRALGEFLARPVPAEETEEARRDRQRLAAQYERLRRARLVNRLRDRPPDERIGYSLFVYRLRQSDVENLAAP